MSDTRIKKEDHTDDQKLNKDWYFCIKCGAVVNRAPEEIEYEPPLDEGIKHEVEVLVAGGIETFESCQGGPGHAYPKPAVRFYGRREEGFKALAIALQNGLNPSSLRRYWSIEDGEPVGPHWEMTFFHPEK